MGAALQRAWLRRGPPAVALLPLSLLYGFLAALRRALYRAGVLRGERLPVPVVVVGNVVAGGAGKTPVVIALVEHLTQRGLRVGVVSRGYGRAGTQVREVHAGSDAREAGDEPLLVKRRTGVPVFVGAKRVEAARALLAAHPQTQVIVSDDGLQHLALARDIELCVFDARGVGNGWLLPAGPLREAWPRRCDFVLVNGDAPGIEGARIERRLADHAVRADGSRIALADLRGQPLTAVAAIAQPQVFFDALRAAGLTLGETAALPDHYDFDSWPRSTGAASSLICTEKDAVKLWRTAPQAWAVPLAVTLDESFLAAFDNALDTKLAKLSSPHGPETA